MHGVHVVRVVQSPSSVGAVHDDPCASWSQRRIVGVMDVVVSVDVEGKWGGGGGGGSRE